MKCMTTAVKAVIIIATECSFAAQTIEQNQFNYLIKRVLTKLDVLQTAIRDRERVHSTGIPILVSQLSCPFLRKSVSF